MVVKYRNLDIRGFEGKVFTVAYKKAQCQVQGKTCNYVSVVVDYYLSEQ